MLERLGYTVAARTSSVEALETFKENPHDYDLVVTDQTMPNMTGENLAKGLMQIRKDIPIILCTGFSELVNEETVKAAGIREFVMKPLVMSDLAETVRKVLDEKS
jgi:CheY-like chemotaxis protein